MCRSSVSRLLPPQSRLAATTHARSSSQATCTAGAGASRVSWGSTAITTSISRAPTASPSASWSLPSQLAVCTRAGFSSPARSNAGDTATTGGSGTTPYPRASRTATWVRLLVRWTEFPPCSSPSPLSQSRPACTTRAWRSSRAGSRASGWPTPDRSAPTTSTTRAPTWARRCRLTVRCPCSL